MKLPLIARTLVHVKPIQIWNRVWRKRLVVANRRETAKSCDQIKSLPTFTFLNTTASPVGWNDARMEKLWLYNLHYFDWLGQADATGLELVKRWVDENPRGYGNGWEPYPISLRIVNWVKFLASRSERVEWMEVSLIEQVKWLEQRLEYHLLANHLLANAKALVFAGAYLAQKASVVGPAKLWFKKGIDIYRKELPEQTCGDGVNFERSPMYHCIILEDLLDCAQLLESLTAGEVETVGWFREYAGKMVAGLEKITGPDGKISKFNDSTEGIAKTPEELRRRFEAIGGTSEEQVRRPTGNSSGFVKKTAGEYTLIAKCGAIGPSYQPGHAHADTFSFELWRGQEKIVGDTGCSTYVPGAVRSYERSTAAHNTIVIDGGDSSEVWAAHRVGRRVKILNFTADNDTIAGTYRDQHGNVINRTLKLTKEGLIGRDEVMLGNRARRKSSDHDIEVRFHLPPSAGTRAVSIDCNGNRQEEHCEFAVGWNRREQGTCVIYRQIAPACFEWRVK